MRLPKGFTLVEAQPRTGWKLDVRKAGDGEVRWTADSADTALPASERAEFIMRGKLTTDAGAAVLQGAADLRQRQRRLGAAAHRRRRRKAGVPGGRLDVLAPGVAAVDMKDAWIRPTVPGQSGTGVFMKLTRLRARVWSACRRRRPAWPRCTR